MENLRFPINQKSLTGSGKIILRIIKINHQNRAA